MTYHLMLWNQWSIWKKTWLANYRGSNLQQRKQINTCGWVARNFWNCSTRSCTWEVVSGRYIYMSWRDWGEKSNKEKQQQERWMMMPWHSFNQLLPILYTELFNDMFPCKRHIHHYHKSAPRSLSSLFFVQNWGKIGAATKPWKKTCKQCKKRSNDQYSLVIPFSFPVLNLLLFMNNRKAIVNLEIGINL